MRIHRLIVVAILLAAVTVAAGVVAWRPDANATAGTPSPIQVFLDCSPAGGIQISCIYPEATTSLDIDVVLVNNTGRTIGLSALGIAVQTDNQPAFAPTTPTCPLPGTSCNPDFNDAISSSFICDPPAKPDQNPSPNTAESYIGCYTGVPTAPFIPDGGMFVLVTVHYATTPGFGAFRIMNSRGGEGAVVFDEEILSLGSCNPSSGLAMDCFGATVQIGPFSATNTPGPTDTPTLTAVPTATSTPAPCQQTSPPTVSCFTPTPCASASTANAVHYASFGFDQATVTRTATPTTPPFCTNPDDDGDGVANGRDNCPGTYNPDQRNTDAQPLGTIGGPDDTTLANGDTLGDACDDDLDNDGLPTSGEIFTGCWFGPGYSGALIPTNNDSDGDRVIDGAECALGSNPNNALSRPFVAPGADADGDGLPDWFEGSIGSDPNSADSDGDGVNDGIEVKGYNTSPTSANTDGDGCADGQEIASVDESSAVNSLDLMLVAQRFGRNDRPVQDVDKSGSINSLDLQLIARQFAPATCVSYFSVVVPASPG